MKKIISYVIVTSLCFMQGCSNTDNKATVERTNDANEKKDTVAIISNTKKDAIAAPTPADDDYLLRHTKWFSDVVMIEIKLGKMAEDQGDKTVLFGRRMVKDYTKIRDRLERLAADKN